MYGMVWYGMAHCTRAKWWPERHDAVQPPNFETHQHVNTLFLRLTYSTEQPQANSSSPSQEIPRLLWNPKVHKQRSHEFATGPYAEPDESNTHPHTLKIHVNIILSLTIQSPKWCQITQWISYYDLH
jgi:hypothetical protein